MEKKTERVKAPDLPIGGPIPSKRLAPSPPMFKRGDRVQINDFKFKVIKVTPKKVVLKPIGFDLPVEL